MMRGRMHSCIINDSETFMRARVTIDDALYNKALELTDPSMDNAALFREAIKTFVRVRAAKRLASLGGAAPEMAEIARHKPEPAQ